MNKLLSRGLTLLILLSSCASQNSTTEITSAAWRDDLRGVDSSKFLISLCASLRLCNFA
jgi:hypothetical protein